MGFIFESSVVELFLITLFLLWSFYAYVTHNYNYWQERNVPCVPAAFPFGTLTEVVLGQSHIGAGYDKCYQKFQGDRYFGIIGGREPTLVIRDPDLIKLILTKDFHHFVDRIPLPRALKREYIVHHLFNMTGQDWRKMRLTLTPTFTSGKMRSMFSLMLKCSDQLQEHVATLAETNSVIDVKDILARFTMDVIATCAFGLEINSMSDKECEFYRVGIRIFKTTKLRLVRRMWYSVVPILSTLYAPSVIPVKTTEFFTKIIRDTVGFRETNSVVRNDFLHMLIRIRQNRSDIDNDENNHKEDGLEYKQAKVTTDFTIEEITAQSFIFFAAGFETASSITAFCLYELACNLDIQDKLYQEIKSVLTRLRGQPTYQALQEMTYMDQVINETLRRYAPLAVLNRTCTESYKVTGSELTIQKGTRIAIPVFSIHHDPEYYPEPYKFDPERFTAERMRERHPYLHLPFGEGPRMCIGMRFGLMQTKIALTTMVYNFKFGLTSETETPIKLHKKSTTTLPEKPVLLEIQQRKIDF